MSYTIRSHRPGDMGMVIHRHGVLYHQEYNWDERFEALVAEICAQFIHNFDPRRERCWIAEVDAKFAGSIFLVKQDEETAKLRLLIVEPFARGLGLGKALTAECIDFARACGYKKVLLWTESQLLAARGIYARSGFRRISEEPYQNFGHDLVTETWELDLT